MTWPPDLPFILRTAGTALTIAIVVGYYRYLKRRKAGWAQASGMLGLAPLVSPELPPWALTLGFFSQGRGQRLSAGVAGQTWGVEAVLGDFEYTTSGGKNQSVHRKTVCALRDGELALPHFTLRPEHGFFDRIGGMLGAQDIDFAEDAAFSDIFVLKGEDEPALRAAFDPTVRAQLVQSGDRPLFLEGSGEVLLLHRDRLLPLKDVGDLLQQAVQLAPLLRRRTR